MGFGGRPFAMPGRNPSVEPKQSKKRPTMTLAIPFPGFRRVRLPENAGFLAALGLISLCYAALRFTFNPPFDETFFRKIYDFVAPIPFGKRVLIAGLSRPLVAAGLSISGAFQVWEAISTFCLLLGLYRLFALQVERPWAKILSAGFAFVLPPTFLLRTPFPYLFPWDTPAMAFIAWGVYFLLRGAWGRAILLMLFATANRESAILIPLLFGALYVDRLPLGKLIGIALGFAAAYAAVSWLVSLTLADNLFYYSNSPFGSFHKHYQWRIFINLDWLNSHGRNYLVLLGTLGGLPVAFLAFFRQIPPPLHRFALVAFLYFAQLVFVGNLDESRIFGEIVAILYIPVALGCCRRATGTGGKLNAPGQENFLHPSMPYLETAAALAIVAFLVFGYFVLKAKPLI